MAGNLKPLSEKWPDRIPTSGNLAKLCDALMKVDGSSPLREPRPTALALLAIYRHVLSPSARERAETYNDYAKMCAELLAAYITLNEGLPQTDLLRTLHRYLVHVPVAALRHCTATQYQR